MAEVGWSASYSWAVVMFLMVLYTCSFVDRTILALMVAPIRADLGISDTQFSVLAGLAFALLYAVAGIPLGRVADRWNRRNLIALGVGFWSAMTMLCGSAASFGSLLLARIGVGVGEATLTPGSYSLLSDCFTRQNLAKALSVFALGVPIGSGLASLIGGPLVQSIALDGSLIALPIVGTVKPWQAVFYAVGFPGLILAVLTMFLIREPPRRDGGARADQPSLIDTLRYLRTHASVYWPIFFGMASIALFSFGSAIWFPSLLQRSYGFTVREAGIFLGASTLALGIAGTLFAGYLADRWIARGWTDAHFRVAIIYGVGMLLTAAVGPLAPMPWLALTLIALSGFFSVTWVGVNAAVLQIVTPNRMRGQMSALYQFFATLIGFGLGPTAVALATDYVFGHDDAVGLSLALVGIVSLSLGCLTFHLGRGALRARLGAIAAEGHQQK